MTSKEIYNYIHDLEEKANNINIVDLRKMSIADIVRFEVDMQLYEEFNDEFCAINDHLGEIYGYSDLKDLEEAEKARRKELIRDYIKQIEKLLEGE